MNDLMPADNVRELCTVDDALTVSLPGECLLCYVWRMLETFGCNANLHWAQGWRDTRAPRASALEHRLGQRGGFCDCEIFLNGWVLAPAVWYDDVDPGDPPTSLPSCAGVRRGSTQPCGLWAPRAGPS